MREGEGEGSGFLRVGTYLVEEGYTKLALVLGIYIRFGYGSSGGDFCRITV